MLNTGLGLPVMSQSPDYLRLFVLSGEMGKISGLEKEAGKLGLWVQVD